ncbi:MAG: hypothetical protein A3D92_03815 [Bacteroidetes bacterium RIFCSPHIGHO2_02_FULL_44_7]|nr:MAG: hypothetical protein A3D92_03815 [Bacteroidetes bacterium RIFCSPHIGHO2_02_FULL_44_7]
MEKHFTLTDDELERQIGRCEFTPADFTHEVHVRLAWILIERYGIETAEKRIQELLLCFVDFAGAKDKYNTTLTVAAIRAVYHFWQKSNSNNFHDFIREFPRLKFNFKELLNTHYGFDIYASDQARLSFMEPDLLPFDE